jgi:hypothetical protein
VTFKFKVKRHIVYLFSFLLEEAYLGRWPRFKEECMGSRGLPNSSFYFQRQCVLKVLQGRKLNGKHLSVAHVNMWRFFFVEVFFFCGRP